MTTATTSHKLPRTTGKGRVTDQVSLHTDRMKWERLLVLGATGYAWIKTLAKDPENGARTVLLRYDPGFRAPARNSVWPADILVLEGEFTAGDRKYNKMTYHYRPAGSWVGPIESATGATRLVFTADSPDPDRSSPDEVFYQNLDTDLPGSPLSTEAETDPHAPMRWRKTLRQDPIAQVALKLARVGKVGHRVHIDELHIHPWTEEAFLIQGRNQDYSADIEGHMLWGPGTYACRPAGECLHGDSLKLDDEYLLIARNGWTNDPAIQAEWDAYDEATIAPLPGPVVFEE